MRGVIKGWSLSDHPWLKARMPTQGEMFALLAVCNYLTIYGRVFQIQNFKMNCHILNNSGSK